MKLIKQKFFLVINLFIIVLLIFCNSVLAEDPKKVLILPFNIYSEKDLSFLQRGIEVMLSTRLAKECEVVRLSEEEAREAIKDIPESINEKTAILLGERLKADYVLFGSLTVFGESISTDARFVDLRQLKPVVLFNQSGKSHSDVIFHIDLFASQINEKVFGRKTYAYQPPAEKKAVTESRKHPDKIWAEEKSGVREDRVREDIDVSAAPATPVKPSLSTWKSSIFRAEIKGLAVGDVDGDQKNETVFIGERNVYIYRNVQGKFIKVGEVKGENFDNLIGVDVADINGNGKSEIFVTNLHENTKTLKSFVLESDGAAFRKIEDYANWYYRVLNIPGRGNILLGQKRHIKKIFAAGVYELRWLNGRYEPGERQILPKEMNVFGFAYGDVLDNGREMIVAFKPNDYLYIADRDGNEEWKSSEKYGGSSNYLEPSAETISQDMYLRDRLYLPQRIHVADLDKDGKNEVIVVKNEELAGRIFSHFRMFKSGHVECLAWDKLGLYEKWKTREISGYISDYGIADIDNDGQDELVLSVVTKIGSVLGKAKSFIVSQGISN